MAMMTAEDIFNFTNWGWSDFGADDPILETIAFGDRTGLTIHPPEFVSSSHLNIPGDDLGADNEDDGEDGQNRIRE